MTLAKFSCTPIMNVMVCAIISSSVNPSGPAWVSIISCIRPLYVCVVCMRYNYYISLQWALWILVTGNLVRYCNTGHVLELLFEKKAAGNYSSETPNYDQQQVRLNLLPEAGVLIVLLWEGGREGCRVSH